MYILLTTIHHLHTTVLNRMPVVELSATTVEVLSPLSFIFDDLLRKTLVMAAVVTVGCPLAPTPRFLAKDSTSFVQETPVILFVAASYSDDDLLASHRGDPMV